MISKLNENFGLPGNFHCPLFKVISGSLIVISFLVSGNLVLAAGPYQPGETLDPSCSPGAASCIVTQLSVATSTNTFGIGTTSPYAALSVVGSTGIVADKLFATSTTATSTFAGGVKLTKTGTGIEFADGTILTTASAVGGGTVGTASAIGQVPYYASASNAVSATSTLFISTASYVGVGTTTPWGQLSINPNRITGPSFVIGSSTGTSFIVNNGGNVGIGTLVPAQKLEVSGNILFSGLASGGRSLRVGTTTNTGADITAASLDITAGDASVVTGNGFGGVLSLRGGIGGGDTGSTGGAVTIEGGSGYYGGSLIAQGADSVVGGTATFRAGDGSTDNGGALTVRAGDGVGSGGNATFRAGDGNGGGTAIIRAGNGFSGGGVTIDAGSGSGGTGGTITITGGTDTAGAGGAVTVKGGTGSGAGGSLTLSGGDSSGSNTNGSVEIKGGTGGDGGGGITIHSSNAGATDGPDVTIYAGNGAAGYVGGDVVFYGGTGDTAGNIILGNVSGVARGKVGIGTSTPFAELSVFAPTGVPSFIVGSSTSTYFLINEVGNVGIGTTSANLGPLTMKSGAYVTDGGTWTNASSRALKENFASLDSAEVLAKINQLSITRWNYKLEPADVTHIGPIAEDFYDAFNVGGPNGKSSISSIDPAGVALIGIQALTKRVESLESRSSGSSGISFATVLDNLRTIGASFSQGFASFADLTAETLHISNKFCVDDVCVNKDQLKALLIQAGASSENSTNNSAQASSDSNGADIIPPVITLNGNNPANIKKGVVYSDMGATVTDNLDQNLGIHASGDVIDTSTVGNYTVTYTATDQAGNTSTTTRQVIVEDDVVVDASDNTSSPDSSEPVESSEVTESVASMETPATNTEIISADAISPEVTAEVATTTQSAQ